MSEPVTSRRPADLAPFAPDARPPRLARQMRMAMYARRPDPKLGKFVLFAQGRSGSSLFGTLLGSHPQVRFGDEILRGQVRDPVRYIEGVRRSPKNRASVYGFHVKIYQLSDIQKIDDPQPWLQDRVADGWTVFYLRRTNLIRHALSNASILHTKRAHFVQGDGASTPKMHIDPAVLHPYVDDRDLVRRWEHAVLEGVEHTAFEYERDLLDAGRWDATARNAFEKLGLEPRAVDTALRRINSGAIADLVENYDEFAAYFAKTPYAGMLD